MFRCFAIKRRADKSKAKKRQSEQSQSPESTSSGVVSPSTGRTSARLKPGLSRLLGPTPSGTVPQPASTASTSSSKPPLPERSEPPGPTPSETAPPSAAPSTLSLKPKTPHPGLSRSSSGAIPPETTPLPTATSSSSLNHEAPPRTELARPPGPPLETTATISAEIFSPTAASPSDIVGSPVTLQITYASGNAVVNNVSGDQHITVYEASKESAARRAFVLLKMLDPARMDATSRPQCLEGTRTALLQSLITDLTAPAPGTNILWLYGVAGSGKSTISTTMAERLHERGQRGPFLFFNRPSPAQSSPDGVIRTLAYKLALSNEDLRDAICEAIEKDTEIATRPLDAQFKTLVLAPLRSCSPKMTTPMVIILDAFDECGNAKSRRALVYLLTTHLPLLPFHFRFLITSRPELDLKNVFGAHPGIKSISLSAVEWSGAADVLRYIRHELNMLYWERGGSDELPLGWPGKESTEKLGSRAGDSFIWAATGIRYLIAADDLDERLDRLLSQQAFSLGDLYATALRSASNWEPSEASTKNCRNILGAVIVGRIPLTDDTMDMILDLGHLKSCRPILRKLSCLLLWSEGLPVQTLHASFADYLTDPRACADEPWFIDESKHHADFTIGCLLLMKKLLRFNICGLKTSYLMNRDVEDLAERIKLAIPPGLAYACQFWSEHLRNANTRDRNVQPLILEFFRVFFLYWLEVLSLIGEGRAALDAMVATEKHSNHHDDAVHRFAKDGVKFVGAFASVIADSAPHVYISTLPFAPSTSLISQCYSPIVKNTLHVTNSTRTDWPSCEQVIEGHTDLVKSVVFSPGGERVASASYDKTVRIWDARTGELVAGPFAGHTGWVRSVAFSPDGERVASSSDDRTIRLWDARTGELVAGPFEGHTDRVNSVVFSTDGARLASGSNDNTIRIWNARTGEPAAGPFWGHTSVVCSVAFSLDGERVASGSNDRTVRIWDARTGIIVAGPFEGHEGLICSVAFSPDGERVASGSWDETIMIWDARTGKLVIRPFEGHSNYVNSVAFSPDGERVVSGSQDSTVCIWNARTGKIVAGPFEGHTQKVHAVAFSPDGERVASGSSDRTIRIWDARAGKPAAGPFNWHTESVSSVVFSPGGERIASASYDKTIRIWDALTGNMVAGPFEGHTGWVCSVAFSPDGERIASGSNEGTIRIWDARTGELAAGPFKGHENYVQSVAWSLDGERVASACDDNIRIWDARTGKLVAGPFEGHTAEVKSVAFSTDGERIASGSDDKTIRIWNARTGKLVAGPFKGHARQVQSVAFLPDGERVASGSADHTVRIWDARSGNPVAGPFEGHTRWVNSVAFSPDGECVASGSMDSTIRLWNARTGVLLSAPLKWHTDSVTSVIFSPDGKHLGSGSKDKTIRIFEIPTNASSHSRESRSYSTTSSYLANGWMQNSPTELLFWVPPEYRTGLWQPGDTVVIGQPSTCLDLTHFVFGDSWARCHI